VGGKQHLDVLLVGDRGEKRRVGRLDTAPEATPEVELPAERKARLVAGQAVAALRDRAAALLLVDVGDSTRDLLHLRIERTARDAEQRATLEDAQPGEAQRRAVLTRCVDQPVERRVLKQLPPERMVDSLAGARRQWRGGLPRLEPIDLRLAVIGAERGAGRERPERKAQSDSAQGPGDHGRHCEISRQPLPGCLLRMLPTKASRSRRPRP
jgi:hypothetical protein